MSSDPDESSRNKIALSRRTVLLAGTSLATASTLGSALAQTPSAGREVLPIPDQKPAGLTTYDAKDPDTKFPAIRPLRPPTGAPNVLIILLDDVGFGRIERVWRTLPDANRRASW